MNGQGQSDGGIVPKKYPNKPKGAEGMEGRPPVKGNVQEYPFRPTQSGENGMPKVLERIREAERRDKEAKLTSLYHHVYNIDHLRIAYEKLKKKAAAGIDGETWQHYGQNLEENLRELSERLARGAYRAKPVRRVYIPKADGRQRPIGIPVLEDKMVQYVTAQILTVIWEEEFQGFSYGFRPKRDPHQALDALAVGIEKKKVNWILDADIRGFFDTIGHEWLVKFIEQRIGDKRIITLIEKWLKVGVLEEGKWTQSEEGTPQGGIISPILANIYLHYVFDLWVKQWRKRKARGDIIVVRYADDFVVGFQYQEEAKRFWDELKERMKKFGLELHEEKTRLIEFGRYAAANRKGRGESKPETFNFLGFTHACSQTQKGWFVVKRKTIRKRTQVKLKEIKEGLRARMHSTIPEQGKWLASVLRGHFQYYGVPYNSDELWKFHYRVKWIWRRMLGKRSQKGRITWERMDRISQKFLPNPKTCHPFPSQRIPVTT
jgi:RNA-directed DNA polymerase